MKIPKCRDISILISRQHETPLTPVESLWLRFHLLICEGCRNFQNNVRVMRNAFKRYLDQGKDH